MVGEVAVHVAKQFFHVEAQGAVEAACICACNAVARVDDDFHRPCRLDVGGDGGFIGRIDVLYGHAAFAVGELFLTDGCQQFLYRFSGQCFATQHHFEAVVVGRVVAAGNHHAAAATFSHGGKIQHGGGYHTDVGYVHAAVDQSANQVFR